MKAPFTFEVDSQGIGWLTFDLEGEKINTISSAVLDELSKILDQIYIDQRVQVLVIQSGKEDVFIAGADLKDFGHLFNDLQKMKHLIYHGHEVLQKIADAPFPTIALIQGICLGGGTELALACTYRVVTDHPKTGIALPETSLGIIPGWGGTQRLPRLIGLIEALDMILTGRMIKAQKAFKMHLADGIVASEFRHEKTVEFALACLTTVARNKIMERRKAKGWKHYLFEANPLGRLFLFSQARKKVLAKTKGHYPAPLVALELIKATYGVSLKDGLKAERETFIQKAHPYFENAKRLVPIFFINEALKKQTWETEGSKPIEIKSAGVLGAGTMGAGIAWLFSFHDYAVRLKDISWEIIGKGYGTIQSLYKQQVKNKKLKATDANLKYHHVSSTIDYVGFSHLDVVIEAATENLELKHKIFQQLEEVLPQKSIIASNTSSLTIASMSTVMKHPERFIGMHFFNPPNRMPLVEVIKGEKTSSSTIAAAVELCKKLGKIPLVVGDCPGFLVNRIFAVGANEVLWLLEEGIAMEKLEKMMLHFGMPMAPFVLFDEVGNDIFYKVGHVLEDAYGERMHMPSIIKSMNERKLYGKKVGKGFYLWKGDKKQPNPEVAQLILRANPENYSEETLTKRVMFGMINEAVRCLEEKIIDSPAHLDMALILGIGFPPFRGGLLRYADACGVQNIVAHLKKFSEKYGSRFTPCNLIVEMSKKESHFY